jgi:hypothetical protein
MEQMEQMDSDVFTKQRFPVRFILPPPILEAQSARNMFERGYLMDMHDACGQSFVEFGKAVIETQYIREANQKIRKMQTNPAAPKRSVLERTSSISNRDLLLGRHRGHKATANDDIFSKAARVDAVKPVTGNMVSRFLNRLTGAAHH